MKKIIIKKVHVEATYNKRDVDQWNRERFKKVLSDDRGCRGDRRITWNVEKASTT